LAKRLPRRFRLTAALKGLTKYGQASKTNDKAKVCELWDKETAKVYWLMENYVELLDERDDPLD
jgi:hypothetical protein